MTSCVDTIILPDNLTVDEDFWKSKDDVESMVNNAYKSMLDANIMARLIVWGDFRSDEMLPNNSLSNATATALSELNEATIQSTNTYADWSYFYVVINNCNIVLEKAAQVMDNDPSYTQGDYLSDCLCTKCREIKPHLPARRMFHGISRVAAGSWGIFSSYSGDGNSWRTRLSNRTRPGGPGATWKHRD